MQVRGSCSIVGVSAYLPDEVVGSEALMSESNCERFGIPFNYISKHIGITERRVSAHHQKPSDLAALASSSLLVDSGVRADEIDLIIFAGISKDYEEPSTAHLVQSKIQANNAVCMDVTNACLGFMSAIWTADSFIKAGAARRVLVCTGETPTKMFPEVLRILRTTDNKEDFKKTLGFLTAGDAGAAMILGPSPLADTGLKWIKFRSRGAASQLCYYEKVGGTLEGEMLMTEISREIMSFHAELINDTFKQLDWTPESVDTVFAHQVGKKPHQLLSKIAQQTVEKMPTTFQKFGNLTSATIPVAMALNMPARGDKLLFLGMGSGLCLCQGGMIF